MIEIVVVGLSGESRGPEVLSELRRLHVERIIALEDAVTVVRTAKDALRFHDGLDTEERGPAGRAWSGLWGALLSALSGSLGDAWSSGDLGLSDDFAREVSTALKPGSSAILARVRTHEPELTVKALREHSDSVLRDTLTPEQDARLQVVLTDLEEATRRLGTRNGRSLRPEGVS